MGMYNCLAARKGASLVLFVLVLPVIFGFGSLVIDVGDLYLVKSRLQNAADAGATAGALDLPNAGTANATAISYAHQNAPDATVQPTTPYQSNSNKIEVVCTQSVPFTLGKIFGLPDASVSARAVALRKFQWAGETLPYINLDDNYKTNPIIEAWENTSTPGEKESINSFLIKNFNPYSEKTYFLVDYMNGVVLKSGFANGQKGDDGNGKLKDAIEAMLSPLRPVYYVLSLSSDIIASGNVYIKDSKDVLKTVSINDLKQDDVIQPTKADGTTQIVLLEATMLSYNFNNSHYMKMQTIAEYDVVHGVYPPNYNWAAGSYVVSNLTE